MDASNYKNKKPGGFLKPPRAPRGRTKVDWTPDKDYHLLLIGLGREVSAKEYEKIATLFGEDKSAWPTAKAIQERYSKLRKKQKRTIESLHLDDEKELAEINEVADEHDEDDEIEDVSPKKRKRTSGMMGALSGHVPADVLEKAQEEAAEAAEAVAAVERAEAAEGAEALLSMAKEQTSEK